MSRLLDLIERRLGRYWGIRNLVTMIVAAMAIVYVSDYVLSPVTGIYVSGYLAFSRTAILQGQLWRVFTFAVVPPNSGFISIIFQLIFLYFTGNLLQNRWGTLRFNLFYFAGMLGSMIAGLITGYATNYYVNLSLLLAVAILYPMMQINLYGILPLRLQWLAVIDLVLLLPGLLNGTWGERIAILIALANVALFFYDRMIHQAQEAKRRYEWKKNWRTGNWH